MSNFRYYLICTSKGDFQAFSDSDADRIIAKAQEEGVYLSTKAVYDTPSPLDAFR